MKIINNTSKKSLPDLFAIASYQAHQRGSLRSLTLAEMHGTENDVKSAVIFAEVNTYGGIITCIFTYSNHQSVWSDGFPGAFNSRSDVIVKNG